VLEHEAVVAGGRGQLGRAHLGREAASTIVTNTASQSIFSYWALMKKRPRGSR